MGIGSEGLFNLKSILNEFGILNGNLTGTNRTGYKGSDHYYGGGGGASVNGSLQYPDSVLVSSHTAIDFSQGEIIPTNEPTHFAISGEGFFLLQQAQDVGVNPPELLTRDGEFRFTNVTGLGEVLTNHNGLVVLRDTSGTGAGPFAAITKADFTNNNFRPSIVSPVAPLDSLKFSKNGATVFEFTGGVTAGSGVLREGSLETANVQTQESLAAMSLNQKKFAAFAAQLKAEQTNLDVVINLIK